MEQPKEYPNQHDIHVTLKFKVGIENGEIHVYDPSDDKILLASGTNMGKVVHDVHQYFVERHGYVQTELFDTSGYRIGCQQDIDRDY